MRVGVVLVLVVALAGCSFVFVRTPDPVPPGEQPSCTSAPFAPMADTVFATGMLALAATTYFAVDPHGRVDLRGFAVASFIGAAIPFALSARHGFRATRTCRAQESAFAQYRQDYRREQAPPQHLGRAGEACWPDGSCDPGLACVAQRCAAPP